MLWTYSECKSTHFTPAPVGLSYNRSYSNNQLCIVYFIVVFTVFVIWSFLFKHCITKCWTELWNGLISILCSFWLKNKLFFWHLLEAPEKCGVKIPWSIQLFCNGSLTWCLVSRLFRTWLVGIRLLLFGQEDCQWCTNAIFGLQLLLLGFFLRYG